MHGLHRLSVSSLALVAIFASAASQLAFAQMSDASGALSPAQRLLGRSSSAPEEESLLRRPYTVVNEQDERADRRERRSGSEESRDGEDVEDDEPLYEDFSRYIRETTGKIVTDALPLKRSAARNPKLPDSYQLGAGDEVEIQVWGSLSARYKLKTDEAGRIFVPDVGSIPLDGVRASDLTGVVAGHFKRIYRGFELRAFLVSSRGVLISVAGQAHTVGIKNVSASHTLLSATLSLAKPSPGGSRRFVEFQREGNAVRRIDLYCFFRNECETFPGVLKDNDTIRIPHRGKLVAITGGVSRPGIYELADSEDIDDLLKYAGGLSVVADQRRVNLYSFGGTGLNDRMLRTTALSGLCSAAAKAGASPCITLKDGDVLDVQLRLPLVRGTVTVVAPGADSIKLEYTPGLRLLDVLSAPFDRLIPRKTLSAMNAGTFAALSELDDRLKRLDLEGLTLYRRDEDKREYAPVGVDYRAALAGGADSASNIPLKDGDVLVIEDQSEWKARRDELPMSVRVLGEVSKPGRYRFIGTKNLGSLLEMSGGLTPNAAVWNAVILRLSDGRNSVNREILDRALKAITAHQIRQEATNTEKAVGTTQLQKDDRGSGTVQTLSNRAKNEVLDLMKDRDLIYLSARGNLASQSIQLAPNDIVLIPPVRDTFACEGAFFKAGEFVLGQESISLEEAKGRCGVIDEMSPNIYHFVSRENRICRPGWLKSCPNVESGDIVVAVPEIVTRKGFASVMDWLDFSFKSLTTLATLKVLTK